MPATRRNCARLYPDCPFVTMEGIQTQEMVMEELRMHIRAVHEVTPNQADEVLRQARPPTILRKDPVVPAYGKDLEFGDYIESLKEWSQQVSHSEQVKVSLIQESLMKNPDRKDELAELNHNAAVLSSEKTVDKLIQILEDRYSLDEDQQIDNLLKEMKDLNYSDARELSGKIEKMKIKWEKLEIGKKPNKVFWRILAMEGREKKFLDAKEEREIKKEILGKEDKRPDSIFKKI